MKRITEQSSGSGGLKKTLMICLLLLQLPVFVFGQKADTYKVGNSCVSIEPRNSVFSLALAGYGFPREGRFSISWTEIESLPVGAMEEDRARWKNTEDFVSMARHGNRLYALGKDEILYQGDIVPQGEIAWIKAGYKNGDTYTVDLERIAVAGDRLYAVGADKKYYMATHSTQGELSARAIVIQSGKKTVALVSVDLCGFDFSFTQEVKKEISKRTKLPVEAIMINATHTHFAPVPQNYPVWPDFGLYPDPIYMQKVVKPGIVASVENALKDMKKSTISIGRSQSTIGRHRALRGDDALYDPTLDVINFQPVDGQDATTLFIASCHPVFRNEGKERFTISGNFPAVARRVVENNSATGNAVFFQGCCADIDPLDSDCRNTGTRLGNDVLATLNLSMEPVSGSISYVMDSVILAVSAWSKERVEQFREQNIGSVANNLDAAKNVRWADRVLSIYEKGTIPKTASVYVQIINIGNWKLVGLSREAVTEYSLKIRELWEPDKFVSVAAYCNDVASYLPNAAHVRAQNYEGLGSFLWYGHPAFFREDVLDTVIDHIKKLK